MKSNSVTKVGFSGGGILDGQTLLISDTSIRILVPIDGKQAPFDAYERQTGGRTFVYAGTRDHYALQPGDRVVGEGTPSGVPLTLDELRRSTRAAAAAALDEFAKAERLFGGSQAHDSFDGILAEHALAIEDVRDELRDGIRSLLRPGFSPPNAVLAAFRKLDDQITYIRALGSVAATEEEEDAK